MIYSQIKKKICALFFVGFIVLMLSSCVSNYWGNYIERNKKRNLELLKEYSLYSYDEESYPIKTVIDSARKEEIIEFFANKDMPSEWLDTSKSTWERSMAIALWVSKNVKHSNPDPYPEHRNCIDLYKWNEVNQKGFNCRMHSIMLHELLLVAGIENRFITCRSEDPNDPDCHVVNIVWLPELNKWAMIDSDMTEYVVDDNGIPLSLYEMRNCLVNDRLLNIKSFDGYKIDKEYLQAYWTKNLFYFYSHTINGFNLEDTADGSLTEGDKIIFLYPEQYLLEKIGTTYSEKNREILTTYVNQFWNEGWKN